METTINLYNSLNEVISLYDLLVSPQLLVKSDLQILLSKYDDITLCNTIELKKINSLFNLEIEITEENFDEIKKDIMVSEAETIIHLLKIELSKEFIVQNSFALNEYNDFKGKIELYYTNDEYIIDIQNEKVYTNDFILVCNLHDMNCEKLKSFNKIFIKNINKHMFKKLLNDNFTKETLRKNNKNSFKDFINQEISSMITSVSFMIDEIISNIPEYEYNAIFAKYLAINLEKFL